VEVPWVLTEGHPFALRLVPCFLDVKVALTTCVIGAGQYRKGLVQRRREHRASISGNAICGTREFRLTAYSLPRYTLMGETHETNNGTNASRMTPRAHDEPFRRFVDSYSCCACTGVRRLLVSMASKGQRQRLARRQVLKYLPPTSIPKP
jgi:hypothetical protein